MSEIQAMLERQERMPYVQFVREAVEDIAASREQGKYVARDVDFVHITPPYTKDKIVREVSDWFVKLEGDIRNERIPPTWLQNYKKQYDAWKNGQEIPLDGTPIKGWGMLSPAMQENLIRMSIKTVEDLALVNDDGMRRIGMGASDLKTKAKAWVAQTRDKGPLTQEMATLSARNRELEVSVQTLQQQVKVLLAQSPVPPVSNDITAADLIDDEHSDLVAQYKAKFGKNPHPKMKPENLAAAVKD